MIEIATIKWMQETSEGLPCTACEEIIFSLTTWRMWMNSEHAKSPSEVVLCESCYWVLKENSET